MQIEEINQRAHLVDKYYRALRITSNNELNPKSHSNDPLDYDHFSLCDTVFGIAIPNEMSNEFKERVREYYLRRSVELKEEIDALP